MHVDEWIFLPKVGYSEITTVYPHETKYFSSIQRTLKVTELTIPSLEKAVLGYGMEWNGRSQLMEFKAQVQILIPPSS